MPIFEYQCDQCEHVFEQLVRGGESIECPRCQSGTVTKLLSAAAGHVRGGSHLPDGSCPYGGGVPPCQSGQCPGAG